MGQARDSLNMPIKEWMDKPVKCQPTVWFCLQENAELFRADTTSLSWKDYIDYIDKMVLDEFDDFIHKSLSYLMDNMVTDVSFDYEIRMCRCVCVGICTYLYYKCKITMLESIVCSFLVKE